MINNVCIQYTFKNEKASRRVQRLDLSPASGPPAVCHCRALSEAWIPRVYLCAWDGAGPWLDHSEQKHLTYSDMSSSYYLYVLFDSWNGQWALIIFYETLKLQEELKSLFMSLCIHSPSPTRKRHMTESATLLLWALHWAHRGKESDWSLAIEPDSALARPFPIFGPRLNRLESLLPFIFIFDDLRTTSSWSNNNNSNPCRRREQIQKCPRFEIVNQRGRLSNISGGYFQFFSLKDLRLGKNHSSCRVKTVDERPFGSNPWPHSA